MVHGKFDLRLIQVFRNVVLIEIIIFGGIALLGLGTNDSESVIEEIVRLPLLTGLYLLLSSTVFHHVLRRWLLPIALLIASTEIIIAQVIALRLMEFNSLTIEGILFIQTNTATIIFLLPLILIAWQHRIRHVLGFSFGITFISTATTALSVPKMDIQTMELLASATLFRIVTLLVVGILVAYMSNMLQKQQNSLITANQRLTHMAKTLEEVAVLRERNRVARELHDTLSHTQSGVILQLEGVDALWETQPAKAQEYLHNALSELRTGAKETRRALGDLRATRVETDGLQSALIKVVEEYQNRSALSIHLDMENELPVLSAEIEQTIYRIVQEGLANCVEHAQAQSAKLRLSYNDKTLRLDIIDNGCGFDVKSISNKESYGIIGMRERASIINGELEINSVAGHGTTIHFEMELT